ncbi:MAG TPA: FdhF/YdeP family oxidoreductase [Acidimicrobiales bacterium]|jgi:molybdopterin-dependent oxidoreductase alpha subunit|nr:FdhF/YdeP family oxidoreductase [Acidimicrobiales bacterium]
MTKPPPASDPSEVELTTRAPKDWAAGLPGVVAALRQTRDQAGVRRGARLLARINQADGFDCPGCAWPDPDNRGHVEFCENGAKAVAEEGTLRRVGPEFFAAHPLGDLRARSDYWLGQQGRLTHPMFRPAGSDRFEQVSWEHALALVVDELRRCASPDRAVFYTSGRTSNEAAFAYQLMVRRFGTNNLPDCSNMCHESSGVALGQAIGIGKGSVTLDDIEQADLLLIAGQNPGTNHPRMLTALEAAKERGAVIVAINPLPEAGLIRFKNPQRARGLAGRGTPLADQFLQIKVGADLALFQLVNRRLVELDDGVAADHAVLDRAFIESSCDGFDALAAHLRGLDERALLAATGLGVGEVDALVDRIVASERMIICWAMGITQHRQGVATIREMANTALLRGAIGKPGAGLCPVRGHSNVQGDRTMGIFEKPPAPLLDAIAGRFAFEPPRAHGLDTVGAIHALRRSEVDVFMSMGGNFASAAPDTRATLDALGRCRLGVSVSTKLNRTHLHAGEASLILPCLGRTERDRTGGADQFVSVEDSMSMVHMSRGRVPPASSELRSEVDIVCALASRLFGDDEIDWSARADDYDLIREDIAEVIPGCVDYNRRVRLPGGFVLPHPPRDSRTFPTASGKAHLTCNHFSPVEVPDGRLLLQTVRSHDQFNTTIYGLDDRYRGISNGRRVVFAHRDDLATLGFSGGDVVDVVSDAHDGIERRAARFRLVEYPVAPGTCAAYFPEANELVPLGWVADESNTPASKAVVVRFEP